MKWQVTAADVETGADRTFVVEAATSADAEAAARRAGYLVSQVTPAGEANSAPAASHDADPLSALAAAATGPAALAYLPPAQARRPDVAVAAPEYWGLRFGSIAFLVFAVVFYLAGLLGVLAALATFWNSLGYASGLGVLASIVQFLLSLWPLALGTVFHALSSACVALRDVARNSFAG